MEIPKFATREEKKAWWQANHTQVDLERNQARFNKHKEKGFKLPDKSFRLIYLILNDRPVGCFVTRLIEADGRKTMEFQFSGYNPGDRYDKSIGRTIALERLTSKPFSVSANAEEPTFKLKYSATECLVCGSSSAYPEVKTNTPFSFKTVPVRIRRVAEQWLSEKDYDIAMSKMADLATQSLKSEGI